MSRLIYRNTKCTQPVHIWFIVSHACATNYHVMFTQGNIFECIHKQIHNAVLCLQRELEMYSMNTVRCSAGNVGLIMFDVYQ
jgi:hypothetical protein